MVRQPVVSGKFYSDDFGELDSQIQGCFNDERGPGALPVSRSDHEIKAIIVPHAGYVYSGPCAAWAYKELAEAKFPKTYILLGFSHHGEGSGISIEDWKTPLGMIKTDKELAIHLKEMTNLPIREDPHLHEHSIEVQLPFLQYISKDNLKQLKILPISIGNDLDFSVLAKQMVEALASRDVVFIVSSDMTHYGPSYGYVPFTLDVPERLNELDNKAITFMKDLDVDGFKDFINKTHVTICGYMPILLMMSFLRHLGHQGGELLMHYMSADLTGDFKNSVSYASIIYR